MPPRKSDAASRKSDVSMARFVPAEDDDDVPGEPSTLSVAGPASSVASPPPQLGHGSSDKKEKDGPITIEDLTLPKSIVTRLAKGVLPPNTQIQANAILAMTKSASVFISHLANAANDRTTQSNKKTIMPQDVFAALDDVEFDFMRPQLEAEFAKFNHVQTSKRSTYRKKVAAAKKAAATTGGDAAPESSMMSLDTSVAHGVDGDISALDGADDGSAAPRSKRPRTDDSQMDLDGDDDGDPSDAESMPDEHEGEGSEDDDEEPDVDEDNDEVDEDEEEEEERDELEERIEAVDEDEALDGDGDGDHSE